MKAFTATLLLNLSITLPYAFAVSPADCNAVEAVAGKALDLVNKRRRDGYLFELLRVADAHMDKGESSTVYYLVLDIIESDCSVLSRKFWEDCDPPASRHPSPTVIGQCKVVASTHSNESQSPRLDHFNCTTSSVFSALSNRVDSPVLIDFFEDTESYRKQAEQALEKYKGENDDFASFKLERVERVSRGRGGKRTNYYLDFSVRNCSAYHFPRHSKVFGFCKAYFSYDPETSDLETPKDSGINCEVFNIEEHRNVSGFRPHFGHHHHPGRHDHSRERTSPHKGPRDHHSHKKHKFECPPHGDDTTPPSETGTPPPLSSSRSRCRPPHFDTNGTHGRPHNHGSSEHHSHGHHSHGHHPHGHHHHHSHQAHGQRPHGHHPHGHHPPGHGFHDYGPCDPPPHRQGAPDHHHHGHGPPPRDSEERGPGRGSFPFPRGPSGFVYRLPPLKKGEVLPPPEANFPISSQPHHKPSKPEIQPFPQSASEACPGKQKDDFPRVSKFFQGTKLN